MKYSLPKILILLTNHQMESYT